MKDHDLQRRIRSFERLFIEHPRIREAESAILDLRLRQLPAGGSEAQFLSTSTDTASTYKFDDNHSRHEEDENDLTQYCVLVSGEPGSGKTRLKDRIRAMAEFREDLTGSYGDVVPLLAFDMPNTPTPKALIAELCEQAGLVLPPRITRNELATKLRRQLQQIGTRLIMIDEAHTLVEGRKEYAVMEAARCLKFLLNTCGVPMVLFGEEPILRLKTSKALNRRIDRHVSLAPYSWSYEDDRFEFLDCLDQLDDAIGFTPSCGLALDGDLASRLYYVSGGHIGLVTKYLAKALKLALRDGTEAIGVSVLKRAYGELHPVKLLTLPDPDEILCEAVNDGNPFEVDRVTFKKMWAAKFAETVVPDRSQIVEKPRGSRKPQSVFE